MSPPAPHGSPRASAQRGPRAGRRALGLGGLALASLMCSVDDRVTTVDPSSLSPDGDSAAPPGGDTPGEGAASGNMPSESGSNTETALVTGGQVAAEGAAPAAPCPGCNVDGECVPSGSLGPTPCWICDPQRAPASWSFNDGVSCDDDQFCSTGDVCSEGVCGGQPRRCDDGIACNGVSTCDETADVCTPLVNLCTEGQLCSSDGSCVATCNGCAVDGNCLAAGTELAGNPCLVCNPEQNATAYVVAVGKACGAGATACSGADTCDAAGLCQRNDSPGGTACGDSRSGPCDASDACDGSGACTSRVAANNTGCDDGDRCLRGDTCQAGVCVSGTSAILCFDGEACNPATGDCGPCVEDSMRCFTEGIEQLQVCRGGLFVTVESCINTRHCDPVALRCACDDDTDPNTTLVDDPVFNCGFIRSVGSDRWASFTLPNVEIDLTNGNAWTSNGRRNVVEGEDSCSEIAVGRGEGVGGWRLPSISEVRSLMSGCAGANACSLAAPGCLTRSCGGGCSSCAEGAGPNSGLYCRPVVPFCAELQTSSSCPDCTDRDTVWRYDPDNGSFGADDANLRADVWCIRPGTTL